MAYHSLCGRNDNWIEQEDIASIHRIRGVPKRGDDGKLSRREALSFQAACQLLGRKLAQGDELIEELLVARASQETNSARKLAEEAAELVAQRKEYEANADLKRQEAAHQFIDNLAGIETLSPVQQAIALAKVLEANPRFADQLEKVEDLVQRLEYSRGLRIEIMRDDMKKPHRDDVEGVRYQREERGAWEVRAYSTIS